MATLTMPEYPWFYVVEGDELHQGDPTYRRDDAWEEARKGRHQGYHVLNQCEIEDHRLDFAIVDMRRAFSLSVDLVRQHAQSLGPRLRLLPPYREHLSQAFARFFMRVGLPTDIPPFGKVRPTK